MYSIVGFLLNGDYSILRNRDILYSDLKTLTFPNLWENIELLSKTPITTYIIPKLAAFFSTSCDSIKIFSYTNLHSKTGKQTF